MTEKEYNECVNHYADNVYRFILKNLRHEEDARDVVQTAFEKMWRNRDEVQYEKSKSYLFTVAYNQMIDHIRKGKRVSLKEEFREDAGITQPKHSVKKILEQALQRLNETQRSLVMLKDFIFNGEFRTVSLGKLMFSPYMRIFVQQFAVITGVIFLSFGGGKIFMLIFVSVKIFFEVFVNYERMLNLAEKRQRIREKINQSGKQ